MRDLTVEHYCMVYLEWDGSVLTQPGREVSSKFNTITQVEEQTTPQNAHYFLINEIYHIIHVNHSAHVTSLQQKQQANTFTT